MVLYLTEESIMANDELLKLLADKADLTLEHMRAMRADIASVRDRLDTLEKHQVHAERVMASIKRDTADIYEVMADHSADRKSLASRIDRIERHIGLTEALSQ
jgi:septal ring factor EnvC (AmiA/AmiB activator)